MGNLVIIRLAPWNGRKDIFQTLQLTLTLAYNEPTLYNTIETYSPKRRLPTRVMFAAKTNTASKLESIKRRRNH